MNLISSIQSLCDEHDLSLFDCGNKSLTEWLKKNALKNQHNGASRTFVMLQDNKVIAYYALAAGSIERMDSPGNISRNMPNPIPVIVLGRLAVDINFQKKNFGKILLKNAMLRILSISKNAGVRAILVHAISAQAKQFYLRYGFKESPLDTMTLFLPISALSKLINNEINR